MIFHLVLLVAQSIIISQLELQHFCHIVAGSVCMCQFYSIKDSSVRKENELGGLGFFRRQVADQKAGLVHRSTRGTRKFVLNSQGII